MEHRCCDRVVVSAAAAAAGRGNGGRPAAADGGPLRRRGPAGRGEQGSGGDADADPRAEDLAPGLPREMTVPTRPRRVGSGGAGEQEQRLPRRTKSREDAGWLRRQGPRWAAAATAAAAAMATSPPWRRWPTGSTPCDEDQPSSVADDVAEGLRPRMTPACAAGTPRLRGRGPDCGEGQDLVGRWDKDAGPPPAAVDKAPGRPRGDRVNTTTTYATTYLKTCATY